MFPCTMIADLQCHCVTKTMSDDSWICLGKSEEISLTFLTGTAIPVGIDILVCNGWNLNAVTILGSFGINLPNLETVFVIIMLSHKLSTPTETTMPVEKVKEIASIE